MQARYYVPVIGRFYSNDPIGMTNIHTFNRYAYANNNPYKYTDPDGKAALAVPAVVGAVVLVGCNLSSGCSESVKGVARDLVSTLGDLGNVLNETIEDLTEEEIEKIHKDCVDECTNDEVDAYENGEKDKIDHAEIIRKAREKAEEEIQRRLDELEEKQEED
jgi:uncharacterized protein RhaS with RHS repeats